MVFDDTGRLAGRGAYLCADGRCWRQALEKGSLQRALEVPLPADIKQALRSREDGAGAPDDESTTHPTGTSDELNEGEAVGQK